MKRPGHEDWLFAYTWGCWVFEDLVWKILCIPAYNLKKEVGAEKGHSNLIGEHSEKSINSWIF